MAARGSEGGGGNSEIMMPHDARDQVSQSTSPLSPRAELPALQVERHQVASARDISTAHMHVDALGLEGRARSALGAVVFWTV